MKLLLDECVPGKFKTACPVKIAALCPKRVRRAKRMENCWYSPRNQVLKFSSDLIAALSINKICREETSRSS